MSAKSNQHRKATATDLFACCDHLRQVLNHLKADVLSPNSQEGSLKDSHADESLLPITPATISVSTPAAFAPSSVTSSTTSSTESTSSHSSPLSTVSSTSPDPLPLVVTTLTLLRAQITKLTLLTINPPFTPAAIHHILSADITESLVPALASVAQLLTPSTYGQRLSGEVIGGVYAVFNALGCLVRGVKAWCGRHDEVTQSLQNMQKAEKVDEQEKEELLGKTGQLFDRIDKVIKLAEGGLPALLAEKVAIYASALEDAIAELTEWRDDAEDEGYHDEYLGDDEPKSGTLSDSAPSNEGDDDDDDDQDALDLAAELSGPDKLPSHRTETKRLLNASLSLLNAASSLFAHILDRNSGILPSLSREPTGADELFKRLSAVPNLADEIAGYLYGFADDSTARCLAALKENLTRAIGIVDGERASGMQGSQPGKELDGLREKIAGLDLEAASSSR